jgi:transglutaminase-like putative cysteine protease
LFWQPLTSLAQERSEPLRTFSKLKLNSKGALGLNFTELFPDSSESAERVNQFSIEQIVTLSEIPANAKRVQLWISIPGDERNQKLMNLEVNDCPGKWRLVNDLDRRGNFLLVEVENPNTESLDVKITYQVLRSPELTDIDATKSGRLNDLTRQLLAEHLVLDAPHMSVTPEFQAIADRVCGDERNLATQAKLLLEHVASTVDHYSYTKDPSMPTCGIGDASVCKKQGGGCCTDLNSYFITLARARGIPA